MLFNDTYQNETNRYKLAAVREELLCGLPEYVTFTTPDPVKFPVPNPEYLAIHAACAKIAHLSGAAELIKIFDKATNRIQRCLDCILLRLFSD
jgi:hypothetical protein